LARILITTVGSYGDLYPYLAVGKELRRRGHAVTIASSPAYRAKVEAEGLAFHAVRPDIDLGNRELLAYVMDARRGSERVVTISPPWFERVTRYRRRGAKRGRHSDSSCDLRLGAGGAED